MKSKSWSQMANAILLVLPLLVSALLGVTNVSADTTDSVNVTLHKRVFDEGQVPDSKTNTGEIDNNFGGTPLAGVTFTAYDVTDHYLNLRSSGDTAEKASQEVQSDAADAAPSYATKVAEGVTAGADGTVTFSNLKSKDGDKDKVYLFVETNSPTNITKKATPIVLAMPIYKSNSDSEINKNIHVYPKNEQTDAITKSLSDKSKTALKVNDGSNTYNATYGQTFDYQLQIAVPWNIADKDSFYVVDKPDLGINDDIDTVTVDGLTKGTDYTVVADKQNGKGNGFKINFVPTAENVKNNAGKKLKVTYNATLTKDAVPDTALNNTATVKIGNDPESSATGSNIYTGGVKFVKQDKQSAVKLAGAKFQLVKMSGNQIIAYATQSSQSSDNGKYSWNSSASSETTSFTSDNDGKFELKGLEYSTKLADGQSYALLETEAPAGYALLKDPVKFTVSKDSYAGTAKVGTVSSEKVDPTITITNIKKGILPSTGGSGIYLFLIAGALLMSGAYVWNKRNKKNQNI